MVVALTNEWDPAVAGDVTGVDYGGQAMVKVRTEVAITSISNLVSVWYLLETEIALASGNVITPTYSNTADLLDEIIHAASYAGARQDAQVVVENKGDISTGTNPITTVDLIESNGNLIFGAGVIGEPAPEGVASWQSDLTEQTDILDSSSAGSIADRLSTTENSVTVELTWVGPVNRAAVISIHFAQVGFEIDCLRETSSTSDATSSATAYEVIPGMEITPGGGDYLAWFSASVNGDGGLPESIFVALFVNGVIVDHTEREIHFDSSLEDTTFLSAATHSLIQPTDGQIVDVRWRVTSGATTMTVRHRTLNLVKLVADDVNQATATGDDTRSSSVYGLMDSMTITPGAGKFALFFTTSAEGGASGAVVEMAVFVNGVIVQHTNRKTDQESSIAPNEEVYAIAAEVNPGVGEAVEIRWRTSTGLATVHERTLTLWKTDQVQEVSATADATTTSASFVLLDSMTLTPDADKYLVIFTSHWESSSLSASFLDGIIKEAGVEVPHTERRSGSDNSTEDTAYTVASNGIVRVNGSQLVEFHIRRSVSGTMTVHERTMILISCAALIEKVATDDIDLEIQETLTQVAVMKDVLDDLDLEITETDPSILLGLINPQDTLDVDLVEETLIDGTRIAQDTLEIDLIEVAELLAQAEVNDSLDLEVVEGPGLVAIMINAQDILDLDLVELTVLLSLSTVQDTLDLDLIEVTEVESQAGVQDTLDLEILEGVPGVMVPIGVDDLLDLEILEDAGLVLVGVLAQDLLDLEINEDPGDVVIIGAIPKVASDLLDLEVNEGVALVAVGVTAQDLLDLSIEEGITLLLGLISPQDLLDLVIQEGDPDLSVEATAQDDLDLEINEATAVLLALIEVLDNVDLEILEDPAQVDQIGVILKIASDLLDLEILEDAGQVAAGITDEDTLSLEVNEDTANLLGLIQPEDTAGVSVDELTEILARAERLDTLDLEILEAAELLALLTRSDTLDLEILEDAGQIAVGITAEDDIDLEILEGIGQVVVGIQANDTLNLVLIEATTLLGFIDRSDSLDIGIVEGVPLVFVRVDVDDILDLALDPEVSDLVIIAQVDIDAADTLDLAIVEGVGQVTVAIQATDLLDLSISEIAQVVAFLNRQDILDLDLGEQADVAVFIQAADQLDIEILDVAALTVALQAADDLDIDLVEFSQIFNALSVLDTLDLDLTEDAVLQAITLDFEGIITKVITLETLKNCPIRLEVTRSVRFTLEIDPGVQRP